MLHQLRALPTLTSQTPPRGDFLRQDTASATDTEVRKHSRVLIVDEHALFRRVVREVLAEHSQLSIVGEATSGTHALTLAAELQPDIVLLDMRLPDMNGVVITRQLLEALPHVRIVILSYGTSDELIVKAMRAGAFGYLTKDIQPEALARAIVGVAEGEVALSRRTAARIMSYFRQYDSIETVQAPELTAREAEVLRLLAQGATDRQIAERLIIAESTAKKHVQHILRKLRARNRAEAVAKYKQMEA